jgi:predicted Zn-dependent protease
VFLLRRSGFLLLLLASLSACAVNPVTGKSELVGMSQEQEIKIGDENYGPMQQSEGGEFDIDPALTTYVQGVGNKLAAVSDRSLPYEFVVLNNSVPNAWALPGGKIALNRGLLTELQSEAELAAVIGHEIVHAAAGHTSQRQGRTSILQGILLGTAIATSGSKYGDVAAGGANLGAQLINQRYGQGDELESDKYGMKYMSLAGYDPQGAVELQRTFVRLSEGQKSDWLSGLFASHPPSQKRVDANVATAAGLPPGGDLGIARFAAAMEKTMQVKPAYDINDDGRKLLSEGEAEKAIEKANDAIAIFPEEGHFYALRGDARLLNEEYNMAVTNYDSAIRRRDDFFYYYLQRGRAQEELEQYTDAKADLEKSNTLLPTSVAYLSLGRIAAAEGDTETAIQHFEKIAGGKGDVAVAANTELARLDLSRNPQKYVLKRCDANSSGYLVVSVKNSTAIAIDNIGFVVEFTDANGRRRSESRKISATLEAGEVTSVDTRLGPYTDGSNCPVRITSARIVE